MTPVCQRVRFLCVRLTFWAVLALFAQVSWAQLAQVGPSGESAARQQSPSLSRADAANLALSVRASSLQTLSFVQADDGSLTTHIEVDGQPCTINLRRHSLRADGFRVLVQQAPGAVPVAVAAPPINTYRGTIAELPGARVSASFVDGHLSATIRTANGIFGVQSLAELGVDGVPGEHAVYRADDWNSSERHTCGMTGMNRSANLDVVSSEARAVGTGLRMVGLAVDADVEFYQQNGSSVANTVLDIETVLDAVEFIYERDVNITYEITTIIVRTAEIDPYAATVPIDLLCEFRSEWNSEPQVFIPRAVAHLFTGKNMDGSTVGIAWTLAVCQDEGFVCPPSPFGDVAYGVSQSRFTTNMTLRVALTAHELGHNWNAGHCNPQFVSDGDCHIMCSAIGGCEGLSGANLRFGTAALNAIGFYRDILGSCDVPVPPPLPLPFLDQFPSMSLDTTKWSFNQGGQVTDQTVNAPSAPFALNLDAAGTQAFQDDQIRSNEILAAGAVNPTLAYATQHRDVVAGERLIVEYRDNALNWQEINTIVSDGADQTVFESHAHVLPSNAAHDEFRLRYRVEGNPTTAGWYVDNVGFGVVDVVEVALRAVDVPTTLEEGSLPTGIAEVCPGQPFHVEIWVSQVNGGTEGNAGGSVDLLFDNTLVSADLLDHGTVFNDDPSLATGAIDNILGLVDDVGGATLSGGKGVSPDWALLARARMSPNGTGAANFSLDHGAFSFALAGGNPPLANSVVNVAQTLSVAIQDVVSPTLSACPAGVTVECDGTDGLATLTLTPPTAVDDCDPSPVIECRDQAMPANIITSGDRVADGTVVTCNATDASSNSSACMPFPVTVADTTPPVPAGCPTDITVECDGSDGLATVTFASPTATDLCDPSPAIECTDQAIPANIITSGDRVADGTVITCHATDVSANAGTCTPFTVTVMDTTAPLVSNCPGEQLVACDGSDGLGTLTFTPPSASDVCDAGPTVECIDDAMPPNIIQSGDRVADGTIITCSASDAAANTSSCPSFGVLMGGPCTCIYDLDLSGTIDLGDFALFAPHFAALTGDVAYLDCTDFYFDGAIDAADVSFFGASLSLVCGDVAMTFPDDLHLPPLPCPETTSEGRSAAGALTTVPIAGDPTSVLLQTVILPEPSAASAAPTPPSSWLGPVPVGESFVAEVWVHIAGAGESGLTGGTVNLELNPSVASVVHAAVDSGFRLFARGAVDSTSGRIRGLGGATLRSGVAVHEWVRFATVDLMALAEGSLTARISRGPLAFAEFGTGSIPNEAVSTNAAAIRVGPAQTKRPRKGRPDMPRGSP